MVRTARGTEHARPGADTFAGIPATVERLLTLGAGREERSPLCAELSLEALDDAERLLREHIDTVQHFRHGIGANCASSVEPFSASVELSPPVTASSTPSK